MPQVDYFIQSMEDQKVGMQDVLGEFEIVKRLELVNEIDKKNNKQQAEKIEHLEQEQAHLKQEQAQKMEHQKQELIEHFEKELKERFLRMKTEHQEQAEKMEHQKQ